MGKLKPDTGQVIYDSLCYANRPYFNDFFRIVSQQPRNSTFFEMGRGQKVADTFT